MEPRLNPGRRVPPRIVADHQVQNIEESVKLRLRPKPTRQLTSRKFGGFAVESVPELRLRGRIRQRHFPEN